jgi:hypothetical protein
MNRETDFNLYIFLKEKCNPEQLEKWDAYILNGEYEEKEEAH